MHSTCCDFYKQGYLNVYPTFTDAPKKNEFFLLSMNLKQESPSALTFSFMCKIYISK